MMCHTSKGIVGDVIIGCYRKKGSQKLARFYLLRIRCSELWSEGWTQQRSLPPDTITWCQL